MRRELNQIGEQIDNLSLQAVELVQFFRVSFCVPRDSALFSGDQYSRFSDIDKDFDFAAALQSIRRLAAECDQYGSDLPSLSSRPDFAFHIFQLVMLTSSAADNAKKRVRPLPERVT